MTSRSSSAAGASSKPAVASLPVSSVIGFSGAVPDGLHVHPDGQHLIYPLGSTVVIRKLHEVRAEAFLQGHSNRISCISVSPSGRYIASGQVTFMGFQADVCLWDFAERKILHRLTLHKVKVASLAFNADERLLATIGGDDDKQICVWDVATGKALAGNKVSSEATSAVSWLHSNPMRLVTAGNQTLRVWDVDLQTRKLSASDCNLGKLKRNIVCIHVLEDDSSVLCGTETGDVMLVSISGPALNLKVYGPKQSISSGVLSICPLSTNPKSEFLVGGGDGSFSHLVVSPQGVVSKRSLKLAGAVTSVQLVRIQPQNVDTKAVSSASSLLQSTGKMSTAAFGRTADQFKQQQIQKALAPRTVALVGTKESNVYAVSLEGAELSSQLQQTCHFERINDVCFPPAADELFASCSGSDIRIWNSSTCAELLRINVPTVTCNCISFMHDGSCLISGWSDGKIRLFGPQTGKLLLSVNDAHPVPPSKRFSGPLQGVTAVSTFVAPHDGLTYLVSGGSDGQVRLWKLGASIQSYAMVASTKEHKATVNAVYVARNCAECISASDDGSCIVWDISGCSKMVRSNILYAQTFFKDLSYLPDESQLITVGTDRRLVYWDAMDCQPIRELEASSMGEVCTCAISPDGKELVSGGEDKLLKFWDYDEGEVTAMGVGHSGLITRARFSPSGRFIVSVGEEGAIFVWNSSNIAGTSK